SPSSGPRGFRPPRCWWSARVWTAPPRRGGRRSPGARPVPGWAPAPSGSTGCAWSSSIQAPESGWWRAPPRGGAARSAALARGGGGVGGREGKWRGGAGPAVDAWRLLGPSGGMGLEGEVRRLAQLRLANPGLGEDEAARLMRRPPGVFVRAAEVTTRLRAGDVVTRLDGSPATPESLDRARQGTREVRLDVEPSGGAVRRVRWP